MKTTKKFQFAEMDKMGASMLELPYMGGTGLYGGDHFSLLIVLPGNNNKLAALEQKLGEIDLKQLFDKKKRNTEVAFVLPKFKISQTIPLAELLKKLGMTDMFKEEPRSRSEEQGFVNNAFQKAAIEVKVAAAAGVRVLDCGSIPVDFRVDQPSSETS